MPSSAKLQRLAVLRAFQPGSGALGTTGSDNAASGYVGEYASSFVAVGAPVPLTTATAANVTSLSLTAGDWDVQGAVNLTDTNATSVITSAVSAGISTTSATLPTDGTETVVAGVVSITTSYKDGLTVPRKRISIAVTTTVYLVVIATFTAGSSGAYGQLTARRVR